MQGVFTALATSGDGPESLATLRPTSFIAFPAGRLFSARAAPLAAASMTATEPATETATASGQLPAPSPLPGNAVPLTSKPSQQTAPLAVPLQKLPDNLPTGPSQHTPQTGTLAESTPSAPHATQSVPLPFTDSAPSVSGADGVISDPMAHGVSGKDSGISDGWGLAGDPNPLPPMERCTSPPPPVQRRIRGTSHGPELQLPLRGAAGADVLETRKLTRVCEPRSEALAEASAEAASLEGVQSERQSPIGSAGVSSHMLVAPVQSGAPLP